MKTKTTEPIYPAFQIIGVGTQGNRIIKHIRKSANHSIFMTSYPDHISLQEGISQLNSTNKIVLFLGEASDKMSKEIHEQSKKLQGKGIIKIVLIALPSANQGEEENRSAEIAINEIKSKIDALMVVPYECDQKPEDNITQLYETMNELVMDFVTLMSNSYLIPPNYEIFTQLLQERKEFSLITGYGVGEKRLTKALSQIQKSPLFTYRNTSEARTFLCLISSGNEQPLTTVETDEIYRFYEKSGQNTTNIFQTPLPTCFTFEEEGSLGRMVKVRTLAI